MLDLGMQELIVICAVALIVFGPKRLPELARTLGKGVGQVRKAMYDIKSGVEKEMEVVEDVIEKPDIPSLKEEPTSDTEEEASGKPVERTEETGDTDPGSAPAREEKQKEMDEGQEHEV
jgi:sec-independent protein translocase protein TatB